MKKFLFIIIISVFTGSCSTSKMKPKSKIADEYQKRILGNVMGLNRLELTASFDECGEWGGHEERFDIYRENKILYAEYVEDIIDCKNPQKDNRKIAERKTIQLNKNHEKVIKKYLNSLLDIGLKMDLPSHAGSYYQAIMNDSTMILKYNSTRSSWIEYEKLKILADFLFSFYLLTFVLNHATNHTQTRCAPAEKKSRMKLKLSILLIFCLCILSCKTNFCGKQVNYSNNDDEFKMIFINDSIFEINPRLNPNEKSVYKYHFLKKEILEKIKENQPSVNFKTKKLYGQFSQKIAIEIVEGENIYFKKKDTLNYLKMRINSKITKRIYFDDGNKFIEL